MSGALPYSPYAFMACCSMAGTALPYYFLSFLFAFVLKQIHLARGLVAGILGDICVGSGSHMEISMAYPYTRKGIMISYRACITILSFSFRVTVLCLRSFNGTLTIRIIFKELLTNVVQLRDHPASAGSLAVFVGNSEFQGHTSNNQNIRFCDSMYVFFEY